MHAHMVAKRKLLLLAHAISKVFFQAAWGAWGLVQTCTGHLALQGDYLACLEHALIDIFCFDASLVNLLNAGAWYPELTIPQGRL